MLPIEQKIKDQYAKIFEHSDWHLYKETADFYFELSAHLLKKDIKYGPQKLKLLRRNSQKRLFIGIGCELLIKAVYLKYDYIINKLVDENSIAGKQPYKREGILKQDLKDSITFTFNQLIDCLNKVHDFKKKKDLVINGLKIAKVFRNKEGHSVTLWHTYNSEDYQDIEDSIITIYKQVFKENLSFKVSFAMDEDSEFKIN